MVFDMPRIGGSGSGSNTKQPSRRQPQQQQQPSSPPPLPSPTPADDAFAQQAEQAALADVHRLTAGSGLHSCGIQVKDADRSKWFYTHVLGMEVVKETENGAATMIWLAFPNPVDGEHDGLEFGQRRGMLQLVHVAGSESDREFRVVHGVPGFCHFCVNVADLTASMKRYKAMGVNIVEWGDDEQGWAAISDPDGYTIQLLHCEIDQSRALKRGVEEMMRAAMQPATQSSAASSRGSRAHDSNGNQHHRRVSPSRSRSRSTSPTRASTSSLALSSFRGGSPDLEHPHWRGGEVDDHQHDHHASLHSTTTSTTDASDSDHEDGFVPVVGNDREDGEDSLRALVARASVIDGSRTPRATRSRSPDGSEGEGGDDDADADGKGDGHATTEAQSSSSLALSSSSSLSSPPVHLKRSTQRSGSLSAPLGTASDMSRSRSGSIFRPNAPQSIDLMGLTAGAKGATATGAAAVGADGTTKAAHEGMVSSQSSSSLLSSSLPTSSQPSSSLPTSSLLPPTYEQAEGGAGTDISRSTRRETPRQQHDAMALGGGAPRASNSAMSTGKAQSGSVAAAMPLKEAQRGKSNTKTSTRPSTSPSTTTRDDKKTPPTTAKGKTQLGLRSLRDRFSFGGGGGGEGGRR